jgi:aminoglycoside phosphotransferase (APT) family kinase protein
LTSTLTVEPTGLYALTPAALVEHFAGSAAFRSRVGAAMTQRLLDVARDWDDGPRAPVLPPGLIHGDFNARNVLVRRAAERSSVAAILDWEFAFAGPLYCDVGNFLRYERPERPRFEPAFSRGLRDGGAALEGDWLSAARMSDLPALCELLAGRSTPDDVAAEVLELVTRMLG